MSEEQSIPSGAEGGLEVAPGIVAPLEALEFQFSRSSGPGGQNVNKLNTKAELWVDLGALKGLHPQALERLKVLAGRRLTKEGRLHLVAETSRTQEANRQATLERLRQLLVEAMHRPRPRRPTRPTRSSQRRRLDQKKRRGQIKARRRGEE